MTVFTWVAVLAATWFVASVVVALVMGRYLRRCAEQAGGDAARPLDTGPLRLWLSDLPERPDLLGTGVRIPAPRATAGERTDVEARAAS